MYCCAHKTATLKPIQHTVPPAPKICWRLKWMVPLGLFITYQMVQNFRILYIKKDSKKVANIVCNKWFLFQEIKKKCEYWNCCLCPSNRQRQQIKLHPASWHYPLMTYLRKNHTKRIKTFLTLIMAFNPRCVWGAPNFSIMTLSSSKLNLPVSLTLNLKKKIINFDFKKRNLSSSHLSFLLRCYTGFE